MTTSDPVHVLPIVLMITMFLQARLQPMGPATDPSQKLQQRMMQYGLPLMFGVMSFFFPAGLTLYIFTNTILSAVHSIYMNKFDKKSLELAAKLKAAQEAKDAKTKAESKPAAKPAKPVIDVESTDDDDEADDEPAAAASAGKPAPRNVQNRPKRKKRRR
jgi:YidC/Oxa1 family membrane protein insertase